MEFVTKYNRPKLKGLECKDESRTLQSAAKDADINNIMQKYEKTGILPNMIKQNPQYGDFSEVPDLLEAHNIINHAEDQFMALDAKTRKKFDNDPAEFLEFVHNPRNVDELHKMGLMEPKIDAVAPSEPKSQGKPKAEPKSPSDGGNKSE